MRCAVLAVSKIAEVTLQGKLGGPAMHTLCQVCTCVCAPQALLLFVMIVDIAVPLQNRRQQTLVLLIARLLAKALPTSPGRVFTFLHELQASFALRAINCKARSLRGVVGTHHGKAIQVCLHCEQLEQCIEEHTCLRVSECTLYGLQPAGQDRTDLCRARPGDGLCSGVASRKGERVGITKAPVNGLLLRGQTGDAVSVASMRELAGRSQACDQSKVFDAASHS